jgi:transcription-repair coupling factor (superfamily II helicase)
VHYAKLKTIFVLPLKSFKEARSIFRDRYAEMFPTQIQRKINLSGCVRRDCITRIEFYFLIFSAAQMEAQSTLLSYLPNHSIVITDRR